MAEVAAAGERAALGQLLLKLTVPGLPDIYNGDELPLLSLVDPDNRRPVDWDARREALAALRRGEDADPKLLRDRAGAGAAGAAARRRSQAPTRRSTPASACARSRAGRARCSSSCRCARCQGATLKLPPELAGAWRDVLTGALREVSRRTQVTELTSAHGLALLERV